MSIVLSVALYFLAFVVFLFVGPLIMFPVTFGVLPFCFRNDDPPPRRLRSYGPILLFVAGLLASFLPMFIFGAMVWLCGGPLSRLMFLLPLAVAVLFNDIPRITDPRRNQRIELLGTVSEIVGVCLAMFVFGSVPFL